MTVSIEYATKLLIRVALSSKYEAKGIKIWFKHNDPKKHIMGKAWAPDCDISETVDLTKILEIPVEKTVKKLEPITKKMALMAH